MRKIFYALLTVVAFASCKKSSFVSDFDKSPEERMGDAIALVNSSLTSSPNGWIATLPTSAGGGYGFYMNFETNQNVTMYSDISDAAATTAATSTYRVTTGLGAMLAFDTYNYLSVLHDPKPSVYNGTQGSGLSSDVEFTYVRANADSLIFVGRQYRQPLVMVKATAAQKASFVSGGYKAAMDKFKAFFANTANPYIEIVSGTTTLKAGVSADVANSLLTGKRVDFTGTAADGKTVVSSNAKFAFTLDGASILGNKLTYQGVTFVRFAWKDATTLVLFDSNGKEYIIKSSPQPLLPAYVLLGAKFTQVVIPNATTYPGWSTDFIARRAAANAASLATAYGLRLDLMNFKFDVVNKKMTLSADVYQGANRFVADFPYTYTVTTSGVFKFNGSAPSGNAALIVNAMAPLTTQRINTDTFTLGYFTHPTTGSTLGLFTSIEHPDFSFTGSLL